MRKTNQPASALKEHQAAMIVLEVSSGLTFRPSLLKTATTIKNQTTFMVVGIQTRVQVL
jgi:hypothetical protein